MAYYARSYKSAPATSAEATARPTIFSPSLVLLLWAAVNVMDALLTSMHIGWGGSEGNPLLASVQAELGMVAMLAAKMTAALVIGLAFTRLRMTGSLMFASSVMAIVVIYNSALIPVVLG